MDLAQMKAAVTMEGVLSGTAALELIAEVERLISLCAEYRGEVDPLKDRITALECEVEESRALCDGYRGEVAGLKAKCEDRRNMLEDVVNELDLSDGMIEQHGPMGTAPATLVRLILERKDREITMLKAGVVPIGAESALTRARAEGMEEAAKIAECTELPNSMHAELMMRNKIATSIRARATKGESDEG